MKTPSYDEDLPDYGDLFTVEEFREMVRTGLLIDYDGIGKLVRDGKMDSVRWNYVYPSEVNEIPTDATHVMWFNK